MGAQIFPVPQTVAQPPQVSWRARLASQPSSGLALQWA
jgi:hypothetical protein